MARNSDNKSAVAQYFKTNLAVVEVNNGESEEEAWRRYLADNPEAKMAQVKIFHYSEPDRRERKRI